MDSGGEGMRREEKVKDAERLAEVVTAGVGRCVDLNTSWRVRQTGLAKGEVRG